MGVVAGAAVEGLFVWWPSTWWALSAEGRRVVVLRFVQQDRLLDCSGEVSEARWADVARVLPRARELSGTFAWQSGANCLGTVVAAFGVSGAENVWLHGGPFDRWLTGAGFAESGAQDAAALGSVLVWRDTAGVAQHAAVSLGGGWVLQKDAQGWFAPRQVLRLADVLGRWHDASLRVCAYRPGMCTGT